MSEQNKREDYTTEFITGVLGGALVGAVLGLWYAPRSGQETISRLKEAVGMSSRRVSDTVQGETVEKAIDQGRALAHENRARQAKQL